jgi:hypothetical protein
MIASSSFAVAFVRQILVGDLNVIGLISSVVGGIMVSVFVMPSLKVLSSGNGRLTWCSSTRAFISGRNATSGPTTRAIAPRPWRKEKPDVEAPSPDATQSRPEMRIQPAWLFQPTIVSNHGIDFVRAL